MEKDINITQEQENLAERYIGLFEQLVELKKQYPVVFSFLKQTYVPEFISEKKPMPPVKAIRHKVVADIYLTDEQEKEEKKELIRKSKS